MDFGPPAIPSQQARMDKSMNNFFLKPSHWNIPLFSFETLPCENIMGHMHGDIIVLKYSSLKIAKVSLLIFAQNILKAFFLVSFRYQ